MPKIYPSEEGHILWLHAPVRGITLDKARQEIQSMPPLGGIALVDILRRKVVFTHRLDLLMGLSNASLKDLHDLILNDFYRIQVKANCHAAGKILVTQGYEHLGKKGVKFTQTFPGKVRGRKYLGRTENWLIIQESEPIILEYPDGSLSFATIDTYRILTAHWGDYLPIAPLFTKYGIPLEPETKALVQEANRHIYCRLPFKKRHLDILPLLSKGKNNNDIAVILGIEESTVETHRRDIRAIVKNIFPDLNDVKMAVKLREIGILEC